MAEQVDTTRKQVQTYVPAYQRDEWKAHADEMDMSLSEFVRCMTQCGRRTMEEELALDEEADLRDKILATVEAMDSVSTDELVAAVTADVEARVDEVLADLQERDRIRHSGRHGGYVTTGG